MCYEVDVAQNGKKTRCETVGQLATALNILPTDVSNDPSDHCLCNARLGELGARITTIEEGWPFPDYIIVRPSNDQSN